MPHCNQRNAAQGASLMDRQVVVLFLSLFIVFSLPYVCFSLCVPVLPLLQVFLPVSMRFVFLVLCYLLHVVSLESTS